MANSFSLYGYNSWDMNALNSSMQPKWRFRFSLSTLMLLMTVGCVGLAWFGVRLKNARREAATVRAIEELGGVVKYQKGLTRSVIEVDLSFIQQHGDLVRLGYDAKQHDKLLILLQGLPALKKVALGAVTDGMHQRYRKALPKADVVLVAVHNL